MSLNQSQYEAVAHNCGPCLVLAGPGSGKTLTIVKRIEYLIQKQKVKPEEILVITFTKYAAKEMKQRFFRQMRGGNFPVTFGTFHGIYYGILKWAYGFGPQNLLSEEAKYQLLSEVIHQTEITMEDIEEEKDFIQNIATEIGIVKNNCEDVEQYEARCCRKDEFREIYLEYEQRRKKQRKIDFDDMLVLCHQLFVTRPDILEKWQDRFRYILIDEFQDINQIQYDVIKMLAKPQDNLFVVGDDDQSIYAFRGAKPEIMFAFKKDYPQAKELILNINYRSTANITKNALRVIGRNQVRFSKDITAKKEVGKTVHVQEVKDSVEESEYVLEKIQECISRGTEPEEIAILFRTAMCAGVMVETLLENHVEFQMREHMKNIYEHFIGENMVSYFRLAAGERSRRDYLGIMNRPNRYLSRDSAEDSVISFEKIKSFYCDKKWMIDRVEQLELDLRLIRKMAPYAAIQYIRKRMGYDEFLKEYAAYRNIRKEELFEVLTEIEERAKSYQSLEEWLEHISEYAVEIKKQMQHRQEQQRGIHLMTMHSAKGLEFTNVFVIGANEGNMPYKKAKLDKEIEEERRLFYVAMTRAKEELIISYVKTKNGKDCEPSRFVDELLEQV
ncbi:MAG: ATP-dependent helicase [Hespellia sp.]|nr:ATP-dependent helicase [Hespellia sp.]